MTYVDEKNFSMYDFLPCCAVILEISSELKIVYANEMYTKMFGENRIRMSNDDRSIFHEILKSAEEPKSTVIKTENIGGQSVNVRAFAVKISNDRAFVIFIDDSESTEIIEKLRKKAYIDPLSKVYNRETAIERIEKKLEAATDDKPCALIVLDIDNFKNINDTFGHLYGDAVIAMAAGSIKSILDEEDIIGRFGGDEFFAYIHDAWSDNFENKMEKIRRTIYRMRLNSNNKNDISCSIGIAVRNNSQSYEELFKQADSALYIAKEKGKNRFEYFSGQYIDEGAISYAAKNTNDENESNKAYNITTVALEIASKSTDPTNAVENIMRHIGVAANLDCIQIMCYDATDNKVYLDHQWWKERDGVYDVAVSERKVGYYDHDDIVRFRNKFLSDRTFVYTPDFKNGFSDKFKRVLSSLDNDSCIYSSIVESHELFFSILYMSWDKNRIWEQKELSDIEEITKILSVYLKSTHVTTERENILSRRSDYNNVGTYTIRKLYEEAGRVTTKAKRENKQLAAVSFDFANCKKYTIKYGRRATHRAYVEFSEMFFKDNSDETVFCQVYPFDRFYMLICCDNDVDLKAYIEEKLNTFMKAFDWAADTGFAVRAGICRFKPGEIITDALETADDVKGKAPTTKCICSITDDIQRIHD